MNKPPERLRSATVEAFLRGNSTTYRPTMTLDLQARALGATIVAIWENFGNANEYDSDNALRLACEAFAALDHTQIEGTLTGPLRYFSLAVLDDCNPEDLTYCEMIASISISLAL